MGNSRELRNAETESAFRAVNEQIAESAVRFDADTTEFICECGDPRCTHRVEASIDEYEHVRKNGATFMLVPGHGDGSIERVVGQRGDFVIVEKVNRAARALVRRLNPRAGT